NAHREIAVGRTWVVIQTEPDDVATVILQNLQTIHRHAIGLVKYAATLLHIGQLGNVTTFQQGVGNVVLDQLNEVRFAPVAPRAVIGINADQALSVGDIDSPHNGVGPLRGNR